MEQRASPGTKTVKKHQLSCDEQSRIVNSVKINKLSHREAAIKYGVSPRLVQSLVSASKKDSEYFQKA